jgi:hypothetical protein
MVGLSGGGCDMRPRIESFVKDCAGGCRLRDRDDTEGTAKAVSSRAQVGCERRLMLAKAETLGRSDLRHAAPRLLY